MINTAKFTFSRNHEEYVRVLVSIVEDTFERAFRGIGSWDEMGKAHIKLLNNITAEELAELRRNGYDYCGAHDDILAIHLKENKEK